MKKPYDLSIDWLADAILTHDQRKVWTHLREELKAAHDKISLMEDRLRELEQQTNHHLPTVLTRPDFNREVARMLAHDDRYGGVSSIVYINLENLEQITALHGKSVANAATRTMCDTLLQCVRTSDIAGRLGVDEFGVFLARCDNANAWKKGEFLASRLHQALLEVHTKLLRPSLTFGAYTFRQNQDVTEGLKLAASNVTKSPLGI